MTDRTSARPILAITTDVEPLVFQVEKLIQREEPTGWSWDYSFHFLTFTHPRWLLGQIRPLRELNSAATKDNLIYQLT